MVIICGSTPAFLQAQETQAQHNTATVSANPDVDAIVWAVAKVLPERNFGYVIGDILTQHIVLPDAYKHTDLSRLSNISRVSTWLERQSAIMNTAFDGTPILTLRYQIINAPQTIISVALPELSLASPADEPGHAMSVAAWPFTLGPLTASVPQADIDTISGTYTTVDGIALRADMTLPELDNNTPSARLRLALLMLGSTLASWAGWYLWRTHRDKVRLPFAHALQALRSEKQRKPGDTDTPWKILHHAFNQSAGHVVNTSSIHTLLIAHDWLRPLEPRIRAFYVASAARHYALPPQDEPFAVDDLAKVLAACEKRNSR
jgi:mxaA protein